MFWAVNNLFGSRGGLQYFTLFVSSQEKLLSEKRGKDKRMGDEDGVSSSLRVATFPKPVPVFPANPPRTSFPQTTESPVSPEPSRSPALSPEPESGVDGLTMNSEECYFCGQRVYVLERISAEGRFFHRSCFSCHHCGITLRLGSYSFDNTTGEDALARGCRHLWRISPCTLDGFKYR